MKKSPDKYVFFDGSKDSSDADIRSDSEAVKSGKMFNKKCSFKTFFKKFLNKNLELTSKISSSYL